MKPASRQGLARRFVLCWLLRCALAAVLVVAALMVAWRHWPPVSGLMVARWARKGGFERSYVGLDRISPRAQAAVVTSEDARFCSNDGVDWTSLWQVIRTARGGMPARGASTITMQTVKNLFLWPSRSVIRKAIEIPLALVLDLAWPKQRILEVYLNVAQWGHGLFGIEAASWRYFHEPASDLNAYQAALLATSLPDPFQRDPAHPSRLQRILADRLLRRMRSAAPWLHCLPSHPT